MKAKAAADILADAIDALEAHGWGQDAYCNPTTGALDAVGALRLAAFGKAATIPVLDIEDYMRNQTAYHEAYAAVEDVIGLGLGTLLSDWNDAPRRTKQQVEAAFARAVVKVAQ